MEHGDERSIEDEIPGCSAHRSRIERFAAGELSRSGTELLRAHRATCPDCDARFRTAVETTAMIGRELRRERVEGERIARHERLRRDIFATQPDAPSKLHRLRTLVYPAFFAFLMIQLASFGGDSRAASVTRIAGEVVAGDLRIDGEAEVELARGEWCSTGRESSAFASVGSVSVIVGPLTRFAVERVDPVRIRLEEGELELAGSCVLSTPHGVLEFRDARGLVRVEPATLRAETFSGTVVHTGPEGARELAAGESLRVGR